MAATLKQRQWDTDVQPHLRRIRHCAKMASYYAAQAIAAAEALAFMPKWETIAESDLKDAADKIITAGNVLSNKPREEV